MINPALKWLTNDIALDPDRPGYGSIRDSQITLGQGTVTESPLADLQNRSLIKSFENTLAQHFELCKPQ